MWLGLVDPRARVMLPEKGLDKGVLWEYVCIMTQTYKRQQQPPGESCKEIEELFPSGFFRALADPNRIALLGRLATCCGSQTVSEVADCCPTDLSVVSRHLATLKQAGIVEAEKRGREVHYRVRYEEIARALRAMADAIDRCCLQVETADAES
jgi:DNA-binding transcriptional ArsR family regulator